MFRSSTYGSANSQWTHGSGLRSPAGWLGGKHHMKDHTTPSLGQVWSHRQYSSTTCCTKCSYGTECKYKHLLSFQQTSKIPACKAKNKLALFQSLNKAVFFVAINNSITLPVLHWPIVSPLDTASVAAPWLPSLAQQPRVTVSLLPAYSALSVAFRG